MKKMRFVALVLFVVLMASTLLLSVSAESKSTVAYVADITIDGEIDAAWEKAPENKFEDIAVYSNWYGNPNKSAGVDWAKCSVKFLWNGTDKIFVLVVAEDPDIKGNENIWVNFGGDHCKFNFDLSYGANCPYPNPDAYGAAAKKVTGNKAVFEFTYNITGDAPASISADVCYTDSDENVYVIWSTSTLDISWQGGEYGTVELSTTPAVSEQGTGDDTNPGDDEHSGNVNPGTADYTLAAVMVAAAAAAVVLASKKRHSAK